MPNFMTSVAVAAFFFFFNNPQYNYCHLYIHVWCHPQEHGQATHGSSPLKKTYYSSPSSLQLPLVPPIGVGPYEHTLVHARIFTCLIFLGSQEGNHSCYKFMCVQEHFSALLPVRQHSHSFCPFLPECTLSLWSGQLIQMSHLGLCIHSYPCYFGQSKVSVFTSAHCTKKLSVQSCEQHKAMDVILYQAACTILILII